MTKNKLVENSFQFYTRLFRDRTCLCRKNLGDKSQYPSLTKLLVVEAQGTGWPLCEVRWSMRA